MYSVVICGCMCLLMGRVLESPGFRAVHVEMFSFGNNSILHQEDIVAIHTTISFNLC